MLFLWGYILYIYALAVPHGVVHICEMKYYLSFVSETFPERYNAVWIFKRGRSRAVLFLEHFKRFVRWIMKYEKGTLLMFYSYGSLNNKIPARHRFVLLSKDTYAGLHAILLQGKIINRSESAVYPRNPHLTYTHLSLPKT